MFIGRRPTFEEVGAYFIMPPALTFALSVCLEIRMLNLSIAWTASILGFIAILIGLAVFDHITEVEFKSYMKRREAEIALRAEMLRKQGEKDILDQLAKRFWDENFQTVMSYADEVGRQ